MSDYREREQAYERERLHCLEAAEAAWHNCCGWDELARVICQERAAAAAEARDRALEEAHEAAEREAVKWDGDSLLDQRRRAGCLDVASAIRALRGGGR